MSVNWALGINIIRLELLPGQHFLLMRLCSASPKTQLLPSLTVGKKYFRTFKQVSRIQDSQISGSFEQGCREAQVQHGKVYN